MADYVESTFIDWMQKYVTTWHQQASKVQRAEIRTMKTTLSAPVKAALLTVPEAEREQYIIDKAIEAAKLFLEEEYADAAEVKSLENL